MNVIAKIISFSFFIYMQQEFLVYSALNDNNQNCSQEYIDVSDQERINKIMEGFINLGQLNEEAIVCKVVEPRTAYAREIIFVNNKNGSKVIKTFKSYDGFKKEEKSLLPDLNLINEINKMAEDNHVQIPKIIVPNASFSDDSNEIWAVIQEEAKGKPLSATYNMFIENSEILNMKDSDIETMFRSIGKQLGNLDYLLHVNNRPFIFHPDNKTDNIFYDNEKQKLYWIDVAGITEKLNIENRKLTSVVNKLVL
jgi:serine/threonine protein kinase